MYLSQQAHQHQITHESPYGNATDVTQKIGYAKKKSVVDLKKAILYNEPEETVMQNLLQPITSIIGRSERATDYFIYKGYILIKRIRLNTGKPEFNCRRTHNGKTRCNITTSGRHNASSDTYILRLPASHPDFLAAIPIEVFDNCEIESNAINCNGYHFVTRGQIHHCTGKISSRFW